MKRYSPRTAKNANTQELLLAHLQKHADRLREFAAHVLDDGMQVPDLLQMCQHGDFYLDETASEVIYICDKVGTRHGGIMHHNASAKSIAAACRFAFDFYTYHKIKAETPDETEYLKAGFTRTGCSPNDGLFHESWVPIITLELVNPTWQVDPGGRCNTAHDASGRRLKPDAGILHAAARAVVKSIRWIRHGGAGVDVCA